MKRVPLLFLLLFVLFSGRLFASHERIPAVAEKKYSGIKTEHVPTLPVEDDSPVAIPYTRNGKDGTLVIVAGAVAVVAVAGYLLLRKKK